MKSWRGLVAVVSLGIFATICVAACDDGGSTTSSSSGATATTKEPNVEQGKKSAEVRACPKCHNSALGTMAGATEPLSGYPDGVKLYPPNLTPDETGIGDPAWSDDKLAYAMRSGFDKNGLNLCPQMKHDANMTDYEAYSIVKYLRSLPPVKNQVKRSVCPPLKNEGETG